MPAAVIVTPSVGTFCNSTTITADNSGSGTIYFQGTTSNGTSGALPSTSESITTSGTYYFRAQSSAGCWGPEGSAIVTINTTPAQPGSITGAASVCDNTTGNAYSIAAVGGATGYTWTYSGAGATINGSTNNITIDFAAGATSGTLSVTADNSCGSSAAQTLAIAIGVAPAAPVATAATNITCGGVTVNWSASANATTYYLDVSTDPAFGSFVTGYNNLNVGNVLTYDVSGLVGSTIYYYRIWGGSSCGTGLSSNDINFTTSNATPATPGAISGTTGQCPALTGQTYSITAVANATTYTWNVPVGWDHYCRCRNYINNSNYRCCRPKW